jgi:hypothetical protein
MISFVEPESLIHPSALSGKMNSGGHSNERSQKQTPRGVKMHVNYRGPETTQVINESNSQKVSATKFMVKN